jgi:DNA-binding NtrC family response regulator
MVVNADAELRSILPDILNPNQFEVSFRSLTDGMTELFSAEPPFDAVLMEPLTSFESLLAGLAALKERCPQTKVILVSEPEDLYCWTDAIRRGAYEFLPKPLKPDDIRWVIFNAAGRHRRW